VPEVTVALEPLVGSLAATLTSSAPGDGAVRAYWLGQAGFVLDHGGTRVAVDPYLSDFLARKYAGHEFSHRRLVAPPLSPPELTGLAAILCTHRHSDHMDPEALPALAAANPGACVVVPLAHRAHALALGVPEGQLRPLDAGESLIFGAAAVEAIPSAHEELDTDPAGHALFLGYAIRLGGLTLYHSGDCIPYPGLVGHVRRLGVDAALLPINGRDAYRRSRGVPGNFHLAEAVDLCRTAGVPVLVGHHYGLFEFNTVDAIGAGRALAELSDGLQGFLARLDSSLRLMKPTPGATRLAVDTRSRTVEEGSGTTRRTVSI
jgi:L-ascorbate metabolism protein UlaG (beta-lactamase superfamily)